MTIITQDFSLVSDTSPFTAFSSGVSTASGTFRVFGGALSPSAYYNSAVARLSSVPSSGVMRIDFAAKNTEAVYGDDVGALFVDASGNGFGASLEGDRFYLRPYTAWNGSGYLGHTAGNVYAAGSEFSATYDLATNVLNFYQNSVSPTVPAVTFTIAPENVLPGLAPAIFTGWYDTGAGGIISYSIEADFAVSTSITSIDQLVGGSTSTIVFSEEFTPTALTISDGASGTVSVSSFAGSGTTWTFTCPALTDGVVGPKLGTVGVTATDGTATTASFSSSYVKTGYTAVVITSLGSGNIGVGFSPALAVGNQEAYDATKGTIAADGIFTGTYTGTQTVWDHNATDFTWRSFTVNTVDGVPDTSPLRPITVENRGFTALGASVGSNTELAFEYKMYIGSADIKSILLTYNGWYNNGSAVLNLTNSITILELYINDGTTSVQVTRGGATTWTIDPGDNDKRCDEVPTTALGHTKMLRGGFFWVKGRASLPTNGSYPANYRVTTHITGQKNWRYNPASTTVSSAAAVGPFTSTGTAPTSSSASGFMPICLGRFFDPVDPPTWYLWGDSIGEGFGDSGVNIGGVGMFQRAVWNNGVLPLASINMAKSGSLAQPFYTEPNDVISYWAQFCQNILFEPGTNNFDASGNLITASTMQGIDELMYAKARSRGAELILRTKLGPRTSSTDLWATEANQTVTGSGWGVGGNVEQFNTWLDTQVGSAIDGVIALNSWRGTNPKLWFSDGVANKYTTDGAHYTAISSAPLGVEIRTAMDAATSADVIPDAFDFTDVTGQATNSAVNSAPITVSGISAPSPISVSGGLYSINGGAYTASSGDVNDGDLVRAQVTTSAANSTPTSVTVTIGGVTGTFTATTLAGDIAVSELAVDDLINYQLNLLGYSGNKSDMRAAFYRDLGLSGNISDMTAAYIRSGPH